jgi:hypothetical protein
MRIFKLTTFVFVVISLYLLAACATSHPMEKLLVGTWVPHKAAPYVPNAKGAPAITGMKAADSSGSAKHKDPKTSPSPVVDEKQAGEIQHVIETHMHTILKLNANKTCEVEFPGRSVNGKWKVSKNGTSLIVKDPGSGEKRTLELVFVNDTSAMVIQPTRAGDIIIRYRKQ